MAKTAIASIEGSIGILRFSFDRELVYSLKRLHVGAQWSPEKDCWTFPPAAIDVLVELLEDLGYIVALARPRDSWAHRLHAALPEAIRRPAYIALSRVLHPDVGGTDALMQELNDAWSSH